MPAQDSLPGFDIETPPTDRLFLAIFPDSETATQIARLSESLRVSLGLHGKPLKTERFHITLHHLGDYAGLPSGLVDAAKTAGATLGENAFDIEFNRVESFSGRPQNRPFVLRGDQGLESLHSFRQALSVALAREGLGKRVSGPFTPHLTLLYDHSIVPSTQIPPIHWKASEFVLVHSLLGKTQHIRLASWPLA